MEFIKITMKNVLEATKVQMEIFGAKDCAYLCYIQHIQNGDPAYYIVKDEDEIIGITGIYIELFEPQTAWLGWYGVREQHRKKGYGTQILKKTIEIAKELGYNIFAYILILLIQMLIDCMIELWIIAKNIRSQTLRF